MGRPGGAAPLPGPGGGVPEPPGQDAGLAALIEETNRLLRQQFERGFSQARIIIVSLTTGGTFDQLPPGTLIARGIIQNISVEDVTVTTGRTGTAAQGILLNAASAAGEGGGSMPLTNIDLGDIWFVRATAGVTLAVYYEQ